MIHPFERITLLITPRCVPHILTGNMWSTKLQCLRQNQNSANLWQTANSIQIQLSACTTLHKTAKQITVVSVHMKPIDMSCSKNETHAKLVTAHRKLLTLSSTTCSTSVQSEIVQNYEAPRHPKIVISLQSQLDSSFITAFAFLLAAIVGFQA